MTFIIHLLSAFLFLSSFGNNHKWPCDLFNYFTKVYYNNIDH